MGRLETMLMYCVLLSPLAAVGLPGCAGPGPGALKSTRGAGAWIEIVNFGDGQDVLMTSLGGARHDFRWQEKKDAKTESCGLRVLVRCDQQAVEFTARILSETYEAWAQRFDNYVDSGSDPRLFRVCRNRRIVSGGISRDWQPSSKIFGEILEEIYVVSGDQLAEAIRLAHTAERLASAGDEPRAVSTYKAAIKKFASWAEEDYAHSFSEFGTIVEFVEGHAYGIFDRHAVMPKYPLEKQRTGFQRLMKSFLVSCPDIRAPVIVVIPKHPTLDEIPGYPAEQFPADARKFLTEHKNRKHQIEPLTRNAAQGTR